MPQNLVVFCDGTGNEIGSNLSNVFTLFRIATRNKDQRTFYQPGIGTVGLHDPWNNVRQNFRSIFGLVTGWGLDRDILQPYQFLCKHYRDGDRIFLFGFSRGAYTVRALAGFIHMMGLLPEDQRNIASYALRAYKAAAEEKDLAVAWDFAQVSGGRRATIHFLGLWDTVSSILVPRPERIIPTLQTLPYTRRNPSVRIVRHAVALDERRRMFRLNRWQMNQMYMPNRFAKKAAIKQDALEVWFPGVHADVGGGYPEEESALSKLALDWMTREAHTHGLHIRTALFNQLVLGRRRKKSSAHYAPPDPAGPAHISLKGAWHILEWLPKNCRWREGASPKSTGLYFPRGEHREVDLSSQLIHNSVLKRRVCVIGYKPPNLPPDSEIAFTV